METASYTFIFAYILLVVTLLIVIIVRTIIKDRNQNRDSSKFAHQRNKTTDVQTIWTPRYLNNDVRCFELDGEGIPLEKELNITAREVESSLKD